MSGYQSIAFKVCAITILLACALWQILFAYREQRDFSEGSENLSPHTRNYHSLTHNAKQKYMLEADLDGAMSLLRQALTVNPSYVPAWLSLAEVNNDLGRKEKAYAILRHADLLTDGLRRWRWDKALTAYQLGRLEMLPGELRYIVREIGGKDRNDALQLAFTLWEEPAELLDRMGHENIIHLLGFAVGKNLPQTALYFWRSIESKGVEWEQKDVLALLDMLLREGEVQTAAGIWRQHFNPETIIFNGDFSQPLLERAFGWKTGKSQNFEMSVARSPEDATAGMAHYRFKGWENINFTHLSQIVPIEGGKAYTLSAEMKSQKLTTDQRPFLEVSGYKCKMPAAGSEMVASDKDWTRYQVSVDVPEDCHGVVVRLRRKESNHIDSKISGQLWLRNIAIAASPGVPPFPEASQP